MKEYQICNAVYTAVSNIVLYTNVYISFTVQHRYNITYMNLTSGQNRDDSVIFHDGGNSACLVSFFSHLFTQPLWANDFYLSKI